MMSEKWPNHFSYAVTLSTWGFMIEKGKEK
jgi:hypothetical protein